MEDEDRLVQFKLLLPAYLKDVIASAAAANRRSLSQEIVRALEASYFPHKTPEGQEAMKLEYILQELNNIVAANGGIPGREKAKLDGD